MKLKNTAGFLLLSSCLSWGEGPPQIAVFEIDERGTVSTKWQATSQWKEQTLEGAPLSSLFVETIITAPPGFMVESASSTNKFVEITEVSPERVVLLTDAAEISINIKATQGQRTRLVSLLHSFQSKTRTEIDSRCPPDGILARGSKQNKGLLFFKVECRRIQNRLDLVLSFPREARTKVRTQLKKIGSNKGWAHFQTQLDSLPPEDEAHLLTLALVPPKTKATAQYKLQLDTMTFLGNTRHPELFWQPRPGSVVVGLAPGITLDNLELSTSAAEEKSTLLTGTASLDFGVEEFAIGFTTNYGMDLANTSTKRSGFGSLALRVRGFTVTGSSHFYFGLTYALALEANKNDNLSIGQNTLLPHLGWVVPGRTTFGIQGSYHFQFPGETISSAGNTLISTGGHQLQAVLFVEHDLGPSALLGFAPRFTYNFDSVVENGLGTGVNLERGKYYVTGGALYSRLQLSSALSLTPSFTFLLVPEQPYVTSPSAASTIKLTSLSGGLALRWTL